MPSAMVKTWLNTIRRVRKRRMQWLNNPVVIAIAMMPPKLETSQGEISSLELSGRPLHDLTGVQLSNCGLTYHRPHSVKNSKGRFGPLKSPVRKAWSPLAVPGLVSGHMYIVCTFL